MLLCLPFASVVRRIIGWHGADAVPAPLLLFSLNRFASQDAKCSLCVGLISLAVVAALVLDRLVSTDRFHGRCFLSFLFLYCRCLLPIGVAHVASALLNCCYCWC